MCIIAAIGRAKFDPHDTNNKDFTTCYFNYSFQKHIRD